MNTNRTQQQDELALRESQQLSQQRTRPPVDIPGYEPRQFLGTGAYGEVWVAVDSNTGRKVAIKFYSQKSGVDWSQLSREVEKLVFLSADRYVVQLLDVGWDANPPYYVMEYVEGGSLQSFVDQEGALPVGQAVELFREIANGLVHAHGKGVLHCDLKPDNILLDQDRRPRLADFGQSRLSHEQRPALGTLFYMAPEQADLEAVPDARWDVYALGALFYCILTGSAPHRSSKVLDEIDSADSLVSRLEVYRKKIQEAPPPTKHRSVHGIDRELIDIVDRCLAVDPAARFPNVQSVLTALRSRDATKDRQPLLLLGLMGPLLFITALAVFGWSAQQKSVRESDEMVRTWVRESSQFAAKFVAEAVGRRISDYFDLVESQAEDTDVQAEMGAAVDTLQPWLADLRNDAMSAAEKKKRRTEFIEHPARQELARRMARLLHEHRDSVASWFVTDAYGIQLASEIKNEEEKDSTVGFDFSRRAYFHGREADYLELRHYNVDPLTQTYLSPAFRSQASQTWKVAVSTPIVDQAQMPLGVIALTVELGQLGEEGALSISGRRFVTLVDGRDGEHRGQILQHPLFKEMLDKHRREHPDETPKLLKDYSDYRVRIDELPEADEDVTDVALYKDPLGDAPEGRDYRGKWIAARAPVNSDLIVLVQEDYDRAKAPVDRLGKGVLQSGLQAFLLMLAGVLLLWYLVSRALRDPNEARRRAGVLPHEPSSLHSMETLELPEKLRDAHRRSG